MTEAEHLESLATLLTKRIVDPASYVPTIRGKFLKNEFRKLMRRTLDGDELWEWEWWGAVEPRNRYSMGWCVVRNGHAIASFCHSDS